jgi:uncharacterized membrane protein YdjX (TVP38/TMEM64 family)
MVLMPSRDVPEPTTPSGTGSAEFVGPSEPPDVTADAGSSELADTEGAPEGKQHVPLFRGRDLTWENVLQSLSLIAVVLVMIWLAFNVKLPSLESLRDQIASWGWAAPLVFVGIYTVVALTPIPVTIMAVTGGVLFGVVEGSILSVVGSMLGSWAAYWLARLLGKSVVTRLLGSLARTVQEHLDGGGFAAVFTLRVLPGMPYWPVNYGAGAFGVTQREFLVAALIGSVPGQVSLVAVGHFVADPGILPGIVLGVAWAVVVVMTVWGYRSVRGKATRPLPGAERPRSGPTTREGEAGPSTTGA